MPAKYTPERFFAQHTVNENGCHVWSGSLHKDGYGQLNYMRKYWLAHRLAWTLTKGQIPDGLCVCHRCDNPPCFNPEHLFLGTHARNMGDMKAKGRRKNVNQGTSNGRSKVTWEQASEIRRLYAAKELNQVQLGERFGITQTSISLLLRNKTWVVNHL